MPTYTARTDRGTLTFAWSLATPAAPLHAVLWLTEHASYPLLTCPNEHGDFHSPRAAATRLAERFQLGTVREVIAQTPPARIPRSR